MPHAKQRRAKIRRDWKRKKKRRAVIHYIGIKEARSTVDPFIELKRIVKEGFRGGVGPQNVLMKTSLLAGAEDRIIAHECIASNLPRTKGDRYKVEMLTNISKPPLSKGGPKRMGRTAYVSRAFPEQVKVIYIALDPKLGETEKSSRMDFYRKEFPRATIKFVKQFK